MNINQSNQYILTLYELYYWHSDIETMADLYYFIFKFNQNLNKHDLKILTIQYVKKILEDGSHYINSNDLNDALTYSKRNNNIEDGINFIDSYWNILMSKLNERAMDTSIYLNDGTLVNVSPYLYWTEEWKNEVCKISKLGYRTEMSGKCEHNIHYKYEMPKHHFIPDNDYGCED